MSTLENKFSLQGFYEWLLEQPNREINHECWETCALGEYVQYLAGESMSDDDIQNFLCSRVYERKFPKTLNRLLSNKVVCKEIFRNYLQLTHRVDDCIEDMERAKNASL